MEPGPSTGVDVAARVRVGSGDELSAGTDGGTDRKETGMLYWALVFFVVAIIAAVFGFGGIASASAGIAQLLFFVFLALLVISLVVHVVRGRSPPVT